MRNCLVVLCVAVGVVDLALVRRAEAEIPAAVPIHHTVFFELKYEPDSEAERAFFVRLDALQSIEVIDDFRRVLEVSPKNPFRYGLIMRFSDRAAYDAYNAHPDHLRFVEEVWIPGVERFQEIDFVDGVPR